MPANNDADLLTAFNKLVADFNQDKFGNNPLNYANGLQGDMAPNVKMKRIDDTGYYDQLIVNAQGLGEVNEYFLHGNGNGTAHHDVFVVIGNPEVQRVDSIGFVSGAAVFNDDSGSRPIAFSFAFIFSAAGAGSWQAFHLWGKDKSDI